MGRDMCCHPFSSPCSSKSSSPSAKRTSHARCLATSANQDQVGVMITLPPSPPGTWSKGSKRPPGSIGAGSWSGAVSGCAGSSPFAPALSAARKPAHSDWGASEKYVLDGALGVRWSRDRWTGKPK